MNQTFKAVLETGQVGYHKPFAGVSSVHAWAFQHHPDEVPINECAAWRLADRLGASFRDLVAPTVLREINGEAGSLSAEQLGTPNDQRLFFAAPERALAAAFIDSIIAQQDRHGGNSRWDHANRNLGLIDHGYTFALPSHRLNAAWFVGWRWNVGRQGLEQTEADAVDLLLQSGDLLGLRAFMLPDRADPARGQSPAHARRPLDPACRRFLSEKHLR